jgi:hypothetical protein
MHGLSADMCRKNCADHTFGIPFAQHDKSLKVQPAGKFNDFKIFNKQFDNDIILR